MALFNTRRYQQSLTAFNQGIKAADTDMKAVKRIEDGKRWDLSKLADAQRKTAQTGVPAPTPAH